MPDEGVTASSGAAPPVRPLLRPWYRIVEEDGEVTLAYGTSVVTLEGAAASRYLPIRASAVPLPHNASASSGTATK